MIFFFNSVKVVSIRIDKKMNIYFLVKLKVNVQLFLNFLFN